MNKLRLTRRDWLTTAAALGTTTALSSRLPLSHGADESTLPRKTVVPELVVDVDVNDEVWLREHAMTEADIVTLVRQLKQNGCQTLLVRCGCLGLLPYRTDLSYPFGFDAADARANAGHLSATWKPTSANGRLGTNVTRKSSATSTRRRYSSEPDTNRA